MYSIETFVARIACLLTRGTSLVLDQKKIFYHDRVCCSLSYFPVKSSVKSPCQN